MCLSIRRLQNLLRLRSRQVLNADSQPDVQTVEVTSVDAESSQMELVAKLSAQLLSRHYPNHIWMIGWAPGMTLVIKHMMGDNRYGFTVDAGKAATISELEKSVV